MLDGVSSYVCFGSDITINVDNLDFCIFYQNIDDGLYSIIKNSDVIILDDTDIIMETLPNQLSSFLSYLDHFCKDKTIIFVTKNLTSKYTVRNRALYKKCDKRFKIEKDGTLKSIKH